MAAAAVARGPRPEAHWKKLEANAKNAKARAVEERATRVSQAVSRRTDAFARNPFPRGPHNPEQMMAQQALSRDHFQAAQEEAAPRPLPRVEPRAPSASRFPTHDEVGDGAIRVILPRSRLLPREGSSGRAPHWHWHPNNGLGDGNYAEGVYHNDQFIGHRFSLGIGSGPPPAGAGAGAAPPRLLCSSTCCGG